MNSVEVNSTQLTRGRLVAVTRQDPQALGELFDLYFDRLFTVAYRMMGDRSRAEDVLQEVFMKVHRAAPQLDPDRDPAPWLATITRNACREWWRKQKPEDAIDDTEQMAKESHESDVLSDERERLVSDALNHLPEDLRSIVVLKQYFDMPHRSIAQVMSLTPEAVRKRYSRALNSLKDHLAGVWP